MADEKGLSDEDESKFIDERENSKIVERIE